MVVLVGIWFGVGHIVGRITRVLGLPALSASSSGAPRGGLDGFLVASPWERYGSGESLSRNTSLG